jgi:hypothetical protein
MIVVEQSIDDKSHRLSAPNWHVRNEREGRRQEHSEGRLLAARDWVRSSAELQVEERALGSEPASVRLEEQPLPLLKRASS